MKRFQRLFSAIIVICAILSLVCCKGKSAPEVTFTEAPTFSFTDVPTLSFTDIPSDKPTDFNTEIIPETPGNETQIVFTKKPESGTSVVFTHTPTAVPTDFNTEFLTDMPGSITPGVFTYTPVVRPTGYYPLITIAPTAKPTATPTARPTSVPTSKPTAVPTAVPTAKPTAITDNYVNSVEYKPSALNATDTLGRVITTPSQTTSKKKNKYVGIFYFFWAGEHGTALYDNSIISKVPGALKSEKAWLKAGGGNVGEHHFWGKPMFGYYLQSDEWVMRKHVQMLTDADIDFLFFDATNTFTYSSSAVKMLKILDEYSKQGWDVPQIVFYTNTNSGDTMNRIYDEVYARYPQYSHLWFYWDGKPLIIGKSNDPVLRPGVKSFFRIKASQWPNEAKKSDGFPWMEFGRNLTSSAVYGMNGRKEVCNVSIAQHLSSGIFSYTAWYGGNDHTRSWHDGANDTSKDAYLYGYNFAEQWEWALKQDPEIITITGWNEWVAQRQPSSDASPVFFVDCADVNTSRDAEPMEGGYGDNYYMQMISYIRKFKGTDGIVERNAVSIDVNKGFSQWNDVKAYYKDYTNDTVDRNKAGFGNEVYKDSSGRNDIAEMKVTEDDKYLYFFVKTVDKITAPEGNNWMNLFISTFKSKGWNGYNYVLNYKAPQNGKLFLGKLADGAEYRVTPVSQVAYRVYDNMMMVKIPKSDLGISGIASVNFKWSDNCTEGDVFGFYKTGDAAPVGRAGYYYGPGI